MDELRLGARLGPVADRHPARLVVAEVRARADLEPALDARRPDLEVVLLAPGRSPARRCSSSRTRYGEPERWSRISARSVIHSSAPALSSGFSNSTISTLSNWWTRRMPAGVLAGRARLAPEARRVGGVADRQLGGLEDLVAVEVGDRDLGRRDQVQLVAGDDVHLVFLVRDLARAAGGRRVDDGRRPDLGHAVLARVDVEEPVDQRRAGAATRRPCRPGSRSPRSWRRGRCR